MAKKLLEQVTDKIRLKGYSYKTKKSYGGWTKRLVLFQNKHHPSEMGKLEIEQFLTYLAVERKVSPSTQNQVFNESRKNSTKTTMTPRAIKEYFKYLFIVISIWCML